MRHSPFPIDQQSSRLDHCPSSLVSHKVRAGVSLSWVFHVVSNAGVDTQCTRWSANGVYLVIDQSNLTWEEKI